MSAKKIIALESLRGFASIYVAIGHWILWQPKKSFYDNFFKFGVDAVTIFFILSGIVIFYSYTNTKDKSLRTYFIRRFRRIYFPFLVAIIVSIIVFWGAQISIKELIGNILMLQDTRRTPGLIVKTFLDNQPLWSLSYEWVFYMIFPFIYPVIRHSNNRVHLVGLFCIINLIIYIMFPNHIFIVLAYFFLWWTGLEIGEYFFGNRELVNIKAIVSYYIIIITILFSNWINYYITYKILDFGPYPFLPFRQFLFAFICLLVTIYFRKLSKLIVWILKPFSYISPISYSIYILHFPICVQLHIGINPIADICIKIILLLSLSYFTEIILQPKINKLVK